MTEFRDARLLVLNSTDAFLLNSDKHSNVFFDFTGLLKPEPTIVRTYLSLLSCEIPYSFYQINDSNNVLNYSSNGTNKTLTVPAGNYNATTLNNVLTSAFLQNGDTTMVITLNTTSGYFIFNSSTAFSFYPSPISPLLGLGKSAIHATFNNSQYFLTPPYPLNLITARNINVQSSAFQTFTYSSSTGTFNNTIQNLTINCPPFGLITYQNPNQNNTHIMRQNLINAVDIQITDQNYNLLDFNGQHWSMSFLMEIVRDLSRTFPTTLVVGKPTVPRAEGPSLVSPTTPSLKENGEPDETLKDEDPELSLLLS